MTEPYVGQIGLFAFNRIPQGWVPCDGRLLTVVGNQALFSLLGTQYGGDGRTNFRVPDLRGRTPLGFGSRSGSGVTYNYQMGVYGGLAAVTLNATQVPPHNHQFIADASDSVGATPGRNYLGKVVTSQTDSTPQLLYAVPSNQAALVALNPASVSTTGAGAEHPNVQPSLPLAYCIATSGLYPQRQ